MQRTETPNLTSPEYIQLLIVPASRPMLSVKTPIAYFFEGLGENELREGFSEFDSERYVHTFLMTTEGIELTGAYPRIRSPKHRRRILELVRALAEDEAE